MKRLLAALLFVSACTAGDGGTGGGDDQTTPDAPTGMNATCPLPESMADLGALAALKAQRCNVSGSMGTRKWYRLSATMANGDIVQLELWPNTGAFAAGAVTTGTFAVDTNPTTCGVCVRAVGDKGLATQKEYFGTGGMVTITAVGAAGAPISATINNATLVEVSADAAHTKVANGCSTSITKVKVDGTVMDVGGGGSGGGGGGGGGTGACPTTVGD